MQVCSRKATHTFFYARAQNYGRSFERNLLICFVCSVSAFSELPYKCEGRSLPNFSAAGSSFLQPYFAAKRSFFPSFSRAESPFLQPFWGAETSFFPPGIPSMFPTRVNNRLLIYCQLFLSKQNIGEKQKRINGDEYAARQSSII